MSRFDKNDRDLLAEICQQYPILMDKGYGADTLKRKKAAWEEVTENFRSNTPGKPARDIAQLQGLWKRMKIRAREEIDEARKEARKTGGGPARPPVHDKSDKIVMDMLGSSYDPLHMDFDDDNLSFQEGPSEEALIASSAIQEGPSEEALVVASTSATLVSPNITVQEELTTPGRSEVGKRKHDIDGHKEVFLQMAKQEHKKMTIFQLQAETAEAEKTAAEANARAAKANEKTALLKLLLIQNECVVSGINIEI